MCVSGRRSFPCFNTTLVQLKGYNLGAMRSKEELRFNTTLVQLKGKIAVWDG